MILKLALFLSELLRPVLLGMRVSLFYMFIEVSLYSAHETFVESAHHGALTRLCSNVVCNTCER